MKTARLISIFLLLVVALTVFSIPGVTLAQDEEPANTSNETATTPKPDKITLSTQYPKIDGLATNVFQFNVDLTYTGAINRVFDLKATQSQGWDVTVTPLYDNSKKISSISMEASELGLRQTVQITTSSLSWPLPEPGEYTLTFEVSSGELTARIDLIAKVTAKYSLSASPTNSVYSIKATSGRDNVMSVVVTNTGTAPVENIKFSSDKTSGWEVTFKPEKIDSLNEFDAVTVDINIKPAAKTVSGDYMINIWASGTQASADRMSIRVTVETPSIWGWVGVIIIVIVVAGLILVFIRFGRR